MCPGMNIEEDTGVFVWVGRDREEESERESLMSGNLS